MSCLFCRIVAEEIPADLVYSDEQVIAFRDINPQAPTHILLIPREHIPTVNDITDEQSPLVGHMVVVAKKIAKKLGFDDQGYRLVFNCNEHGGQEVYHLHLHLLGGRPMQWPPG